KDKIKNGFMWFWNRRNLFGLILFGFVLLYFLWGWIGTLTRYIHGALLYGMNEYYLGQIGLAVDHIKWFAIGFFWAIAIRILQNI
ncbi:MAG: hypothetical protein ACFFDP_07705, partial [Promethearchaeota archaeon]